METPLCRSLWFVNGRCCLILADIWGSIVVMICVTMTLVDVMGYMHFWGLTIDVVSSVIIIISIGLCVDYSAHIAHAFLSVQGAILHTYLLFFAHCSKIWETKCNLVKFLESVKNYIKETYLYKFVIALFFHLLRTKFWYESNQISTY